MNTGHANFAPFEKRMLTARLPGMAIRTFRHYYKQLVDGATGLVHESEIEPVDALPDIETMQTSDLAEVGAAHLSRAVIIKLNGGLGTSMGMQRAKSLLKVKKGLSFLDIIARQALNLPVPVPVIFMNSFSTREDTVAALAAYPGLLRRQTPLDFLQHKVPKVDADTLGPADSGRSPDLAWCPPGHGDLYAALLTSGTLNRLLKAGRDYAFVSNADNLGAFFDFSLLGYFVEKKLAFMMEVADRTETDRKGGHLARLRNGRLVLREVAQTADADVGHFRDIARHRFFNTNNIWIHLPTLKTVMRENNGVLGLPMLRNRKTIDPRDPDSRPVYQLETALGAAISVFESGGAIRVPRARFIPVKDTNDLLAVRSDNFLLDEKYRLIPNPRRKLGRLRIDLDPAYYKLIDRFERRFPFGAPAMLHCESLKVEGDIRFGRSVQLNGGVALFNNSKTPVDIEDRQTIQGTRHFYPTPGPSSHPRALPAGQSSFRGTSSTGQRIRSATRSSVESLSAATK